MTKVRICADTTCDLTQDILDKFSIATIPMNIVCEEKTYQDGVEITPDDVYRLVEQENKLCSTVAINTFDYTEFFKGVLENAEKLVYIPISSDISSCFQNANIAAEEFPGRVFVVDSKNLSSGTGHIVYQAALMAEEGMDAEEIAEKLRDVASRVEASFVVDTMEYLKRGGRCSSLMAFGANMLKIKPCIEVKDGKMTVGTTYRGSIEKCLKRYVRDRLTDRDDLDYDRIFITHASCSDETVEAVRELVREHGQFKEIIETYASCTICCHCGPGTLGILFLRK